MANVSEIQIGNTIYALVDATVQSGLSGKQNTISDLSTIRSNASTGNSQATTAINRLNNFTISTVTATHSLGLTSVGVADVAGGLGPLKTLSMDKKTVPSGAKYLGTSGFYTGKPALITTRVSHQNGVTELHFRNMTTSDMSLPKETSTCRDIYIKKG